MDRPYLKIAESANSFFQSLVLSTIFVFNSNISQIRSIFEKILAPILFPLVVIPDAIASLFALYRFTSAKNKNLGLTFDLIHVPIKTALVFTAVFAGLSLIYVQSLFFAAVGSSALYHASLSLYHAYHWQKAEKNSSMRALHKCHTIDNIIATTIGSTVIAGIVLTMVVTPYLGATVLAVAGVATATMLLLSTVLAIYRNFKNPISTTQIVDPTSRSTTADGSETSILSSSTLSSSTEFLSNTKYYQQTYSEKFTGDYEKDQEFMLSIINSKKKNLEYQIIQSERNFFGRLWSQKSKRNDKIELLNSIEAQLSKKNPPISDNLFKPSNKAFQSFFKEKGDVENIANAARIYFQQYSHTG